MDAHSWINKNCVFAAEEIRRDDTHNQPTPVPQESNTISLPPEDQKTKPKPLSSNRTLNLPAGQVLFHGSYEEFDESQLHVGGYDKVLWTTDDKYGPAMAQSYIPRSGSSTSLTPKSIVHPTQEKSIQNLQKMLGIHYDYESPNGVVFDRTGRASSWSMPSKSDGSKWGFEELTSELVDRMLKEKGWKPMDDNPRSPEYNRYEILHGRGIHDIMPPGQTATGRLFILKAQQPLRIYDYAGDREGDLTDVDYHKTEIFRQAEAEGYDGIRINDYAQLHDWGNVGHHAIGIFEKSIPKLKWETIPAKHPALNKLNDQTPEWQEYQSRQQGPTQAWVRGNCKFAQ